MVSNKFIILLVVFFYLFSFVYAQSTGSVNVNFYTGSGAYLCERNSYSASWINVSNNAKIVIYNSTYNTTGLCNNTLFSSDFCCPKEYFCEKGACIPSKLEYSGDFCNSLTSNESCNTAPSSFATSAINSFGGMYVGICGSGSSFLGFFDGISICSNVTSCGCVWNSTTSKCTISLSQQKICNNGTITDLSSCSWSEEPDLKEDLCYEQGKIVVGYSATGFLSSGVACTAQQVDYPCSVSVQLPFFDKFNFIFTVLAIVGIYAFMRRELK